MGMTKGLWRRSRDVNNGYRARYRKKPAKGVGVYALQLPGAGPNGVHVRSAPGQDAPCLCGGCSGRLKRKGAS
jgi:hypothetical protein